MDPLVLLQDYASRRELAKVRLTDTRVEFEDAYTFPRDTLTAYRGRAGVGDFYSLETLLVWLRHGVTTDPAAGGVKFVSLKEYLAVAKTQGSAATVNYIDRKELLDFLTTAGASSPYVKPSELEAHLATTTLYGDEPAAKRARLQAGGGADLEAEADGGEAAAAADDGGTAQLLADIARHERELRDRNTALSVLGKRFGKTIDIALRALKQLDPKAQHSRPGSGSRPRESITVPVKPSRRYERPAGEDTSVKNVGDAIQIQTYGPRAQPATPAANGSGLPPPPPPPTAPQEQLSQPQRPARPTQHADASRRHSSSSQGRRDRPYDRPSRPAAVLPLVLVPKGFDTKLNMFNAQAFMEEGTYSSPEAQRTAGVKKSRRIKFQRKIGLPTGSEPRWYEITDEPPAANDTSGWKRVLAVFVQGKDWQFRGWPFQGVAEKDFVDLFNKVLGVYLRMQDEQAPELVKSCNVKVLHLQKHDRHRDREAAIQLFKWMDEREQIRQKR